MPRIALIFDNTLRPETTGTYVLRALSQLVRAGTISEVEHFLPTDLHRIPSSRFDLFLAIDDGLDYEIPTQLRPLAWWAIDTHVSFARCLDRARQSDWTFAAQRDGAQQLRNAGIAGGQWLPLACDPLLHGRQEFPVAHDLTFIGNCVGGERQRLLALLEREFPGLVVDRKYFEEMAAAYSTSRIVFNRSVANDINMRVFEGLCSGSLLLTNALPENGLPVFFEDGVHLATYGSDHELLDKARYYLRHPDKRKRIAREGRLEVLRHHTYRQRMEALLEHVGSLRVKGLGLRGEKARTESTVVAHSSTNSDIAWLDQVEFAIKSFLRPRAVLRLLRSIVEFHPQSNVTIVDDGNLRDSSDPDSRACRELLSAHPRMRLIDLPFDSGVVAGRNRLIEECTRPYVLLLDDDFCLTADTGLHRLWQRLQAEPDLDVIAGMCRDVIDGRSALRNSGGTLDLNDGTLTIRTDSWRDEARGLREYVPQFALVRREVFDNCRWRGGLGAEHYDFCLQLMQHGKKVAQERAVIIDHYPATPSLPGYRERRMDVERWQQWLLEMWGVDRIVQNGEVIVGRALRVEGRGAREGNSAAEAQRCRNPNCRCRGGRCAENCRCGNATASCEPTMLREADTSRSPVVKDSTYFEFDRPDVLELVPTTARRVLDLGCGGGRLGLSIKERQGAQVTGVELNATAARIAQHRLDRVLQLDLTSPDLQFPRGSFDCVVCADILEHIRDPLTLLRNIRKWLTPDGTLVTSIPNVRNHTVLTSLLSGNWTYESAGLLDEDHVRFFTRREVEKLLYRAGFETIQQRLAPGPGTHEWQQAGSPRTVSLGPVTLECGSAEDAAELFAYQFLTASTPRPLPDYGLTSIVLVTHNQLPYTKACLDSLRMRTDEPYELIVVDNASTDGTVEYLGTCRDVQLIRNAENRGFPAAANQGIRAARGEQVLLLNNDTVVTTGWLESLLRVLHADDQIGLVGPVTNRISGEQQVDTTYRDLMDLDGFAWDWRRQHRDEIHATDRLVGFCLLIRRDVIERIGLLDERFGIGNFEDDDYCRRATNAGFQLRIAREAFIHHFGSATFRAVGKDFGALLRENQRKYEEKWASDAASTQREIPDLPAPTVTDGVSRAPVFLLEEDSETCELLLVPNNIVLSVCLIVRDNQRTIRPCLESIAPWVDEIIVVDTGSVDDTPRICEEHGARVFHWPWRDSFAAARNESLRHARGQWVFWMDSDDTIPAECGRKLRALAHQDHPDSRLGFVMQVHCPGEDATDVTAVDHIKLVRNRAELEFEFRIHEQILPAIRRAGGQVAWTDIYVVHSGSEHTAEVRANKHARDLRLLELEQRDRPDHPFVLFNLGMTYADAERYGEAITMLERCLQVSGPDESHLRKAYSLLASALSHSNRSADAESCVNRGLALFPTDKELLFRKGMLLHQRGALLEAVSAYQRVLEEPADRHFTSVDVGLAGFKCRHNLALVYEQLGKSDDAEQQWQQVIAEAPGFHPAWRCLLERLLNRGDEVQAEALVKRFRRREHDSATAHLLQSHLWERTGRLNESLPELERAVALAPDNIDFRSELCRWLCHHATPETAKPELVKLLELAPDHAPGWHNLGVTLMRLHETDEAASALERSLDLRPDSPDTVAQLIRCRQHQGARLSEGSFVKECCS